MDRQRYPPFELLGRLGELHIHVLIFISFCFKYGKTALDFAESFGRKVSKKMKSELMKL